MNRRLVICVCLRESGVVRLPVERGGRMRRLDAVDVTRELEALVARRGLTERVRISDACAGGCHLSGPNVTVTVYPVTPPGERPDHVAIRWRSYVASLASLECLAQVVDDSIDSVSERETRKGRRRPGR